MNESQTRAELIDPLLKAAGWGSVEGSQILREYAITAGAIQVGGGRGKRLTADYLLLHKGIALAVVEAKALGLPAAEGVAQAKNYGGRLQLRWAYATNGEDIYEMNLGEGNEGSVAHFPSPEDLWQRCFAEENKWRETFAAIPFEDKGGQYQLRYYQQVAVQKVMEAVATGKERILLTLATGTGKTPIAFQIAWKLFESRWNLQSRQPGFNGQPRRPRILFLADRNLLANQAFNKFSAFPEDAMVRIEPKEIAKKKGVPTNGSIFFTIFQTFMSGQNAEGKPAPYFGDYPKDFFDFIIIDECHRGGANDEGTWRGILDYFSPAVQLGLTATPKRQENADTYQYFGEPVFVYSLKQGINDGFLTPFKVRRIQTTLDDYRYTSDDTVLEGEVEEGKLYEEKDFNRTIEIEARERARVQIFLGQVNQQEKTLVFCANQAHAAMIRDLINQLAKSGDPFYCVRVTANDGAAGDAELKKFQDSDKTIPTILTTSQKLSTGVDATNVRHVVLLRPVNSMTEFKQIVGRGTRLHEGKTFFTIWDFVNAYEQFNQPEWDGDPVAPEPTPIPQAGEKPVKYGEDDGPPERPLINIPPGGERRKKIKVMLANGKEREIQHMSNTSFWSAEGKPITATEFLNNLLGELPKLFESEAQLRQLWSHPLTRRGLLNKLDDAGFPKTSLLLAQQLVDMEKSDLYDVLEYVFNGHHQPLSREQRAGVAQQAIVAYMNPEQQTFIRFVLDKYVQQGVDELDQDKLPLLLGNKYQSIEDAKAVLGELSGVRKLFLDFQAHLYEEAAA